MLSLSLPDDLKTFLATGKQFDLNPSTCEAGAIKLLPLDKLALELFPMYADSDSMTTDGFNTDDPHRGENGYYLVEGVNLVAECSLYDPCGLLMWLPRENCYGIWDSDHWHISVFPPEHTWSRIAADPAEYIDSGWGELTQEWPPKRPLIPWPKYRYSEQRGGGPFPYTEPE
jgi:hypothetical protein